MFKVTIDKVNADWANCVGKDRLPSKSQIIFS